MDFLTEEQKPAPTMMDTVLAVDPYKKMAYSDKITFDINTRCLNEAPSSVIVKSEEDYNPEVSIKKTPSKEWELDVRALISTRKWLQNYGLQKNKLSIEQILPVIGFKVSDDYDSTLKRPVSSRYAEGRFNQLMRPDGKMFNITCGRELLKQLENRLSQALTLYKRRLDWLTTESRRLFGVIEERAVTIVLDICNMSPQQFDLYRMALERVLYEQITQIAKFNLIRANDEISMYQDHCVPVTHDTIEGAIKWLWGLDRLSSVSSTACVEGVLRAIEDTQNEAIYLYTEGSSVDTCRQLLKEKVCAVRNKPPIHTVSYNCANSDTVRYLRELAAAANGKTHVYAVIMEMDSYEGLPVDPKTNKANIILKKKTIGGIPAGAGVREDVILLFEEMEAARKNHQQIQKLIGMTPEPNIVLESELAPQFETGKLNEQYMSSRHWLEKHGLAAKKLDLFDALGGVAFHHRDGVVDMQKHPLDEYQTDAKLVNAKYCDRFPVVKWKDGKVVHVQVTPELHRTYEQKMLTALRAVQSRIDWLNQGSRALFGTLIEDQIYIAIDTSESMVPSIQFVKDKLFLLMQEQLRHKMKFNLIAFNSKAQVWQNRLVDVTETSLEEAWRWIQGLSCWGSTNTYAAVQHALSDPGTQAIYLLTDGRPDQSPESIIAQVQMQHSVPVHTISFNCNDTEANQFMYDLARATGGRYHYFSEKGVDLEGQRESFESEDIRMLKDELSKGLDNLDRVAELRDECAKLSWKKEIDEMKQFSRKHSMPGTDRVSAVPAMDPKNLYRSHTPTPPPRPSSAPPPKRELRTPTPPLKVTTSVESRAFTLANRRPGSGRPSTAKGPMKPLAAGHTWTSLLRTLNSQGKFNSEEWLLPETRQLFQKQATRQKSLARVEAREQRVLQRPSHRNRRLIKSCSMSTKQWLHKHGLVARKLTLLDALAPTMITHKSKYVPILDKHVLAKVFDDVLPIAHVSNRSKRSIKLINPNGVDLKSYEDKLERIIALYNRRLDMMVWNAISQDVRDEEFGEIDGPVSFLNNRLWFMKALEEANWPVNEQDILLLEDEIETAEKYLQQSKDLRNAANNSKNDDDLTVYSDKDSNASGLSARSKELSRSKESISSSSTSASKVSARSKDLRNSKSSKKSNEHLLGSLEVRKKSKIGSRLLQKKRQYVDQYSIVSFTEDDEETVASETTDQSQDDNMVGLRVIACNMHDGLYYSGTVVSHTPDSAFAVVTFSDEKRQKVCTQMIIPMSGAIARPELAPGDFVLVGVYNQTTEQECYVPGIVEVTPEDFRQHNKFYSVLLYNGQRETTIRRLIVKIGRARFEMAIRYITHLQQQKILRDKQALSDNLALTSPQSTSTKKFDDETLFQQSSQSGRGRRKKEKLTKKLKKETEKVRKSKRKSRSRSRTNSSVSSRSNSRASSGDRSSKASSRSKSSKASSRSSSSSKSRSRSRTRSSSGSSRSRSRGSVKSGGSSTPRAKSPYERPHKPEPRSRSESKDESRTESKTGSRRSVRKDIYYEKSFRSTDYMQQSDSRMTDASRIVNVGEKDEMIQTLQHQFVKQKRKQLRQERTLVRQARKINKIQIKMKSTDTSQNDPVNSSHTEKSDREKSVQSSYSETDTSPRRRKGSPDGTSYQEPLDRVNIKPLNQVNVGRSAADLVMEQEVLARWTDDGWYYMGYVIGDKGDQQYIVKDNTGYMEVIDREDILTNVEHRFNAIQPEDYVIGLHPKYVFSFAPAEVMSTYPNNCVKVEFFDGNLAELASDDVYKISKSKYEEVVDYIKKCDKHMVGLSVVAREDNCGLYKLGVIDSRVGLGQQFYVKWLDGDMSKQNSNHIFEVGKPQTNHEQWCYVLAPTSHNNTTYMPAEIIQSNPLTLQLCDGRRTAEMTIDQCFWISKEYYTNARALLLDIKQRR